MGNIAIRIENLSKQYRIGGKVQKYNTFREILMNITKSVIRRLKGGHAYQHEEIWALKDVSFDVPKGEVIGVIGRNGAGKTTLLKILSRITEPTEGSIELYGRVGSLLEVGTGFHPELTGRENIYLNGAILGMKRAEIREKFDEIVNFAEIEKFIDTPVKRYSSGMYVRLAFAVAAHLDPEILLVDEVLAVGDSAFQKKCLGKMGDVAKAGRTVLLVSHNMGFISQLSSRCVWLEGGKIQQFDSTSAVIEGYLKAFDSSEGEAEAFFEEDQGKDFQLLQARLLNYEGIIAKTFSCDEPVIIELLCQVRKNVPGLYGYLQIMRSDGGVVMVSDSHDTVPNPLDELALGRHSLYITIPARSLAPGQYAVYMNFTSRMSSKNFNVDSPGVISSFQLDDYTSLRGNKRGGYFSTLLDWRVGSLPKKNRKIF